MSRNQRIALLGLAAVVAIVAIAIAASGGGRKKHSRTTPAVSTAPAQPTRPAESVIRVVNAKPVGGVEKITVRKGDTVRLTINSDVADEVHVHGYDFKKQLPKGGTVRFVFPAKIDGVFPIELEGRGEQIASLRVRP